MERALAGEAPSDVPCGSCTACCRASQFVHVGADETDALAHIPAELLFPAPGLPAGNMVMGYDADGHCPMLADAGCSIYAHRPRTCRTYDCRVFAAAGVDVNDPRQADVARQARRWRFDHVDEQDTALHEAVRAAARFVRERDDAPANATEVAVLAVRLHAAR
jgi:Fe-S-cluster containining protein